MKRLVCFAAVFILCLTVRVQAEDAVVKVWDVYEISMTAGMNYANPYVDGLPEDSPPLVRVTFTATNGPWEGEKIRIPGFWDGGDIWKVRFAPPAPGAWSYVSESEDAGLNGQSGSITVVAASGEEKTDNPVRRGMIQVHSQGERAGRYFTYADGTPFLWIGDTWWNWAKEGIAFSSFKQVVDDRVRKGFTIGQIFLAGRGFEYDGAREATSLLDPACAVLEVGRLRDIDRMIAYANERGMTVWLCGWWSGDNLDGIGKEHIYRWWKYIVSRYAAYNTVWVISGEYNMKSYGGRVLSFWKELGRYVDSYDPYERIISVHPTPPGWGGGNDAPQWSTGDVIHNEGWLDYNQIQIGHDRWRSEVTPYAVSRDYARMPVKPTVVTEPWYEFITDRAPAGEIRYAAWSSLLSGAAGHSYGAGGIWEAHVPEAPTPENYWPNEFAADALGYPGGNQIGFMARFFRGIEWWKLEPYRELVSGAADLFCAAVPGKEYVVYSRWGGPVRLTLSAAGTGGAYQYTWFNPRTGTNDKSGSSTGRKVLELVTPDMRDWVLHVVKK